MSKERKWKGGKRVSAKKVTTNSEWSCVGEQRLVQVCCLFQGKVDRENYQAVVLNRTSNISWAFEKISESRDSFT